jgi:hypothetical protein
MKGFTAIMAFCGAALLMAGCALPMGDDLVITRDGNAHIIYAIDYNLETYVPIPSPDQQPVSAVDQADLSLSVVWKDQSGNALPGLTAFADNTVYQAELKLRPKEGYGFWPSHSFGYHPGKVLIQNDDRGEPVRTVTVTYNSSSDADIIFVTDYNLQNYVPIPQAGEAPVSEADREGVTVTVDWEEETPADSNTFVDFTAAEFAVDAVYRALIQVTAKPGYRLRETDFAYPEDTVEIPPGANTGPDTRTLTVTYKPAGAVTVISEVNLTPYIPNPTSGGMPVVSLSGTQYTGTVIWMDRGTQTVLVGPFQAGAAYTAEVTLTPAPGYTFTGAGTFIHTGADTVTKEAGSGTIRIDFLAAASPGGPRVVYDTNLTHRVPKPAYGLTPVTSFPGDQYTGSVVWKNTATHAVLTGSFQHSTAYTAVVTLRARSGFTFTGIGENVFAHDYAGSVSNPAGGSTITINFPPDPVQSHRPSKFGPVEDEGSALKLMKERRYDSQPFTIELPAGTEPEQVAPDSVVLKADVTSPARITIDGGGRTLKLNAPGILLSVDDGVTLTLQNITLIGRGRPTGNPYTDNESPLVEVRPRGRLILGEGAILTGNASAGVAGGVWVNGGELIMHDGSVIKSMEVLPNTANASPYAAGGGVFIDNRGSFVMHGGLIGSANPGYFLSMEGNSASGYLSGGGVLVLDGSFEMYDGLIQGNDGWAVVSAGGVGVAENGTFTMYGGRIAKNMAEYYPSGSGGVFTAGTCNLYGGVITENSDFDDDNYGVYVKSGAALRMKGPVRIMPGNRVFLENTMTITITGGLDFSPAADIIMGPAVPTAGTALLSGSPDLIAGNHDKFHYAGAPNIDEDGNYQP